MRCSFGFSFFFFNDTATTEIYTLSLHDALPISDDLVKKLPERNPVTMRIARARNIIGIPIAAEEMADRKSTRLNSSHANISYAVFCLKKNTDRMIRGIRALGHARATPQQALRLS